MWQIIGKSVENSVGLQIPRTEEIALFSNPNNTENVSFDPENFDPFFEEDGSWLNDLFDVIPEVNKILNFSSFDN